MLAILKLEYIAENYFAYKKQAEVIHEPTERYASYMGRDKSRPWVARIDGLDSIYGLARTFMKGQIDYSNANRVGSRGRMCL
jgi:hypothetical protein